MIQRNAFLPATLIVATFLMLLSLGFWQLDRADEKRQIEQAISQAEKLPAKLIQNTDELIQKEHHQILIKGHYDNQKQLIYDNQIVNSNAGYYVLTPFILENGQAILVNRGFMPWQGSREKMVDINVGNDTKIIKVKLITPKKRIQLKEHTITKTYPKLIQSLDIKALSAELGYPLIPMLAQLDVGEKDGFYRKWQPFYGSVDKHLGYALQWFLMALVLGVIAIRLAIKYSKN